MCWVCAIRQPRPKRSWSWHIIEKIEFSPLTNYYPDLFNELRANISKGLDGKWNYTTGVDLLLFSSSSHGSPKIDWSKAAVVQSKNSVGPVFLNVEDMVRTILNLNEAKNGLLTPETLNPTMNRKHLGHNFRNFAKRFGGDVITGGIGAIGD